MSNQKIISNIGGAVAFVSIFFLPVVGCGGKNVNGIQIVQSDHVSADIKAFIMVSVLCAGLIIILKSYIQSGIAAITGLISLLVGYFIVKDKLDALDFKIGGILATIGFVISAIINLFKPTKQ